MRLVILETPYAGDVDANVTYARACMRDCLLVRREAPFASHLLYTQPGVLSDPVPDERGHGILAGLEWGNLAEASVVYVDRGISTGMRFGIQRACESGRLVELRSLIADEKAIAAVDEDLRAHGWWRDRNDEGNVCDFCWQPTLKPAGNYHALDVCGACESRLRQYDFDRRIALVMQARSIVQQRALCERLG